MLRLAINLRSLMSLALDSVSRDYFTFDCFFAICQEEPRVILATTEPIS